MDGVLTVALMMVKHLNSKQFARLLREAVIGPDPKRTLRLCGRSCSYLPLRSNAVTMTVMTNRDYGQSAAPNERARHGGIIRSADRRERTKAELESGHLQCRHEGAAISASAR